MHYENPSRRTEKKRGRKKKNQKITAKNVPKSDKTYESKKTNKFTKIKVTYTQIDPYQNIIS